MSLEKVVYTAKDHTTGGRDGGASRSSDGHLDVKFTLPGKQGDGTNPEQLLAAGWSACFLSAMAIAANKMHVALPPDTAIDAEVDLCLTDADFFLKARLNVSLPGIGREVAQAWVDAAHPIPRPHGGTSTSLSAWREPKCATTRRSTARACSPPRPTASSAKDTHHNGQREGGSSCPICTLIYPAPIPSR